MPNLNKILNLLFLLLIFSACEDTPTIVETAPISCEGTMFGLPISTTGLDTSLCKPYCECKNFVSRDFTNEQIATLRTWTLSNPYSELTSNPYDEPVAAADSMVCAVIVEDLAQKIYRLESFPNVESVDDADAILTHHDACGYCSTLKDFAVYAENRDVGDDVRTCMLNNLLEPFDTLVSCLQEIGFTKPCAQIWAYNGRHTQQNCFQVCISDTIYHLPDGSLSPCLQCDEDISGPIFKAEAGRTRRNTGLASSICRPCAEVEPVEHNYPF